jgi:hypothetical protein
MFLLALLLIPGKTAGRALSSGSRLFKVHIY